MGVGNKKVIAVDFDGTLCTDEFPRIGKKNEELVLYMLWRQQHGDLIILWTCRTGHYLQEAIAWCEEQGLYFDAVNENIKDPYVQYAEYPRKIFADEYYDDRAVHTFKLPYTDGAPKVEINQNAQRFIKIEGD